MRSLTLKMEAKLGRLGALIARAPKRFIALSLLFVLALALNLPKTTVDTSTEGFLHESDPARIVYDQFRDQFGRDEKIVIAVKTDDIFKLSNLEKMQILHQRLREDVPYLYDINSLINARNTIGEKDKLLVDDLMLNWPQTQQQADQLKQLALNNPMYRNILLNSTADFAVIVLESNTYSSLGQAELVSDADILEDELSGFDTPVETSTNQTREFITDRENSEMVKKVAEIVAEFNQPGFEIYVAGSPSVTAFLKSSIMGDMRKFIVMIIVAIALVLALLFRRVSGVLLPLLTVFLAVVSTMGLMALTGTPVKVMTQVLPSFLLAVGVGASIHVLAIFYKKFDQTGDKAQALEYTLQHSGLAIIMTSLTTAAGMASFVPSTVAPVSDLGLFAFAGVMIALVFTLVFLPAMLMVLKIKQKCCVREDDHHDTMDKWLKQIADFSQDHAKKIVAVSLVLMLGSIAVATKIGYSHNPLEWFPENHPTRIATETIDHEMRGSISLELIIDTGRPNGLYDIPLLQAIEKTTAQLEAIQQPDYFVGKAVSVVDVIKEIHQALNNNNPQYHQLPDNAELVAQEILLFENSGSDDLQDFVDSRLSMARITIKAPWIDAFEYHQLLEDTAKLLQQNFDDSVQITTTGMVNLLLETTSAAIQSAGLSYMIAFVVIGLMLILLLSSIKLGLLAMIPNSLPVLFVLGVMVLFDWPLDLFTMLIGAIVLGIAVDDIVHFMHNFRRYHLQGYSTRQAVEMTLTTTGRAMMITTVVLVIGFMLYMLASMNNLFLFGLLTAVAFAVALLAVFLLAPALMALTYPDNVVSKSSDPKNQ